MRKETYRLFVMGFGLVVLIMTAQNLLGSVEITAESLVTGTSAYAFPTIASPSVKDYVDVNSGNNATVLIGNRTSGTPSGLITDGEWRFGSSAGIICNGSGADNNNDTANNIIFADPTLYGKIQFDLMTLVTVTQINVYAWSSASSRCRQAYAVWGSTLESAPAAGNTDDAVALSANGWTLIATVPLFGGTDDQTASQIKDSTGSLGQWRHLLFSMGDGVSGSQGGQTMYSEIDIHTVEGRQVRSESLATGTPAYAFTTIAPPSSTDLVDISCLYGATVLIGNQTSGMPSGLETDGEWRYGSSSDVIRNGSGAVNFDDAINNIIFADPTLYGKIQFELPKITTITQINVYAWSKVSTRCRQAYTVWGSTAESAPAAGNTDDAVALSANGWTLIATVPLFGGTDDQTASQITDGAGTLGEWRHLLFSMGDGISGSQGGQTMYSEIDIHGVLSDGILMVGAEQFNSGNVSPSPLTPASGDLLETSVASVTGENSGAYVRNGSTGTAYETGGSNPAVLWARTNTVYTLDITEAKAGYDISEIRLFSGWNDSRAGQSYRIEMLAVGDTNFVELGTVNWLVSAGALLTRTYRTGGLPVATNVVAVRFTQIDDGDAGAGTVFREFDVLGYPSTLPPPRGTVILIQ
ncbi:MAG: hypothetical protein PF904_11335 [Kiritimatiellae bacterium]|jgi:hypothetical protein|nr:hypothetical protein [Kiritimatiellia bacterium]